MKNDDAETGAMPNTGMTAFTLRFRDDGLESEFRRVSFPVTLRRIRFGLIMAFVLYGAFGILDSWIIPEAKHVAWIIRFAVVCPYFALFYLVTYLRFFRRVTHASIAFTAVIGGAGIILMIAFAGIPGKYLYYSGLILVIMFSYAFVGLRFVYAAIASWSLVLMYWAVALIDREFNFPIFLNNSFFFVSANIIGMVAGYLMEQAARKDFLQMKEIERNVGQLKQEIAERERMAEQLRAMTFTDDLTGLHNRRGFFALAEQQLRIAKRQGKRLVLLFVDLDDLKRINDAFGHYEGDRALTDIGRMLRANSREADIVARIGGDEFVILPADTSEMSAEELLTRFQEQCTLLNEDGTRNYRLSISIGTAQFDPDDTLSLDELLVRADQRMYETKKRKQKSG